jgi:hypothetical protein
LKKQSIVNNRLINSLVRQLRDILDGENWLDENFRKKIQVISAEQAFTRPHPEMHSVAELISHIMAWRKDSILKLKGFKGELKMDSPDNWRTNEELQKIGWDKLIADFYQSQEDLIQLIKNKDDYFLENKSLDGYTFEYLLGGLIHHDLYHLGQLGITIKYLNLK